jgi:hypothetical protein
MIHRRLQQSLYIELPLLDSDRTGLDRQRNATLRPLPIIAGIFVATLANHLLACSVGEWVGSLITPNIQ